MNIPTILSIILIHWFADFVIQTDSQAKGKSNSWKPLLEHTFTYSIVWFVIGLLFSLNSPIVIFFSVLKFVLTTFVAHTITDYYTSRINADLWQKGETHNFFVSVGFDQVLHYAQLFVTYYLLFQ